MPDYRFWNTSNGKRTEVPVEEAAKILGLSVFDTDNLLKGMNCTKEIVTIIGRIEKPNFAWDEAPNEVLKAVANHVADQLKKNPSWGVGDFDWDLIWDENENLKFGDN